MASNSSSSTAAASSSYDEPFRGLPPIVLGHILTFAVPFLLPSTTVRALCRDLKEEVDGDVLHQQYGAWATSLQMLTAACLRALLCAPDLKASQTRLPVPDVSAVGGGSMGAPTCLDVKGDFACVGFANGEALVISLPRATDGLGVFSQPVLAPVLVGTWNEGQHQQQHPGIMHRIVAHTGKVTAVILLGGGHVLTGGEDGAVKLWAPASAGGGLLRTFRPPPPSRAAAAAGGTAVEAIVCEDPDLFVLSSSYGPGGSKRLSLTWFDLYTGQSQANPCAFKAGVPPPGQVNESPFGRLGCLAWDGRGRHLFVGGVERGAVLMFRATEGSGELVELGSLRRHTGVAPHSWAANGPPQVMGLQVYEVDALPAFAYPSQLQGGWDRGERRLVAADADRCLTAWTIPSEGAGVEDHVDADNIKSALLLRWPAGSRQCLALDAVSNTGLLLAAFYGAQSPQCLEMEGAIKREALNQMGGSVLIPRLWAAGGVVEAAVEEDGVAGATGQRLKRTTELIPSLFPYGQPATCLQLQRSTGRLVIGLMDGSLRLVSLRSSEGAWDQLRRLQQPQQIPQKRKRAREDESA